MTTYNSYEAAKIANPEKEILKARDDWSGCESYVGKFIADKPDEKGGVPFIGNGAFKKCNPADHCMTVEKFLADGHKFVEGQGDAYIDNEGIVRFIGDEGFSKYACSDARNIFNAHSSFILRAAALETKEPKRTKVEYVKCDYSKEWKAVRHYNEVGELFVVDCTGNYTNVNDISGTWYEVVCKNYRDLYQCIETPIEWWEDASEFINQTDDDNCSSIMEGKLHVNATLTQDQWCDFARILLEQGE